MNEADKDMLLFCAFRYAIGRRTYIVSLVGDLLIKYKGDVSSESKELILKEIGQAIAVGMGGMDCDVAVWTNVIKELSND